MIVKRNGQFIKNSLKWLDENILPILAGFLLVFIPLYPKLPLFDILPGYIVRIRLEDFLIGFTFLIWLIWVLRKKISLSDNPLLKPILLYLVIGLLSVLSAVFIVKSVPLVPLHIQKMLLHYFRRIEYFSLFFIVFSCVKNRKVFKIYLLLVLTAVIGVTIYGFGQKYLYWPAFSTMNREFAKGWLLYLTDHSRVLSTFGGHYDLAAYLMMILVLSWSMFFAFNNRLFKIVLIVLMTAVFWLLILTASRTSFLAYLAGASIAILLWTFRKNLAWMFSRWFIVMFLSIFIMLSFGDLSERFTKLLRLNQRLGGLKEALLRPATNPPQERAVFLVNNLQAVTSKSDQPPSQFKPGERPFDVTENILLPMPSSSESGEIVMTERIYSQAAMQYDLSTGIRLDALWPRAINGFLKNPLLGSGYSTLTKTQTEEFTEAESTDNDYLRMLGETGLLGTLAFLGIIITMMVVLWRALSRVKEPLFYGLIAGMIGLTIGLLINAVYIDVFEASKVAYFYWGFAGLILGGINLQKKEIEKNYQPFKINLDFKQGKKSFIEGITSDRFLLIIILILAFYLRLYRIDGPVADWHSWRQADTAAVTRNFERSGINMLYPTFDDLSSIPSGIQNPRGLRMVEFPLYNALSVIVKKIIPEGPLERSMRLTSIFASLGSLVFIFKLCRKYLGRRIAFISASVFAILPYNIYYSRTILPEPLLVFLSLGGLYFFDKFLELDKEKEPLLKRIKYFVITALFSAVALLVKPIAVFMVLPMLYLAYKRYSVKLFTRKKLYLLVLLVLIPFILWRLWISQFPEGIPAYTWLFNGDGIRFKGAFFQWIFADRISRLILGYYGLPLLIIGILVKPGEKEGWLFRWMGIAMLLYLFIFATGNVKHDYYQVFIIPAIVIFVAKGIDLLLSAPVQFNKILSVIVAFVCVFFMEAFGWYHIRDFFNINHPEIVKAGEAVVELTPKKALVIAPYGGDTAFLYQTQRAGWPIIEGSVEELIKRGADYYVSVNINDEPTKALLKKSSFEYLEPRYTIRKFTDDFVIIQLVSNSELPKD